MACKSLQGHCLTNQILKICADLKAIEKITQRLQRKKQLKSHLDGGA